MTKQEIESQYKTLNGRIISPGKFEGCPDFVPHFYDISLIDNDYCIPIMEEDIKEFPSLNGYSVIHVLEDSSGFVSIRLFKPEEKAKIVQLNLPGLMEALTDSAEKES